MDEISLHELLRRYRSGECSEEEKIFLESWYLSEASKNTEGTDPAELTNARSNILRSISEHTGIKVERVSRSKPRTPYQFIAIAASVLIFLGAGAAFYFYSSTASSKRSAGTRPSPIHPGHRTATLLLANGQVIDLEKVDPGDIASQGSVRIKKQAGGILDYEVSPAKVNTKGPVMNTLNTPAGGEYQVKLADGTTVLLNAGSSLTFPAVFTGKERHVTLSGEAYFEVAHNASKPFYVNMGEQTIKVLGTHFNVHDYQDETLSKTTLIEGSISLSSGINPFLLKPGEQAVSRHADIQVRILDVDTESVVAWKNNKFQFDNEPLDYILHQIARWYDVKIKYEADLQNETYTGSISKYAKIEDALNLMASTGTVHFKIEGRTIMVRN